MVWIQVRNGTIAKRMQEEEDFQHGWTLND